MAQDAPRPVSGDETTQGHEPYEPPAAEELETTQPIETAAAVSQL